VKLLVIARPFLFHGGVERATAGLAAALVELGHDVDLLSPGAQPALEGVRIRRLRLPPLPPTARLLAMVLGARLVVARGAWDLVQSHERTLSQDIYRAGEGCHRAYLASVGHGGRRRLYHRLVLALEARVFATTPRIVAIARAGCAEIERLYGVPAERLVVVYNGVDLERFHPRHRAALRAPARAEAGIPTDAFTALFVGSGFERKGLATAVESLAAVADPRSRLLVVGKGRGAPYRRLAERLGVLGRIVWLGPREDIERWYAASDVSVLPTRYEPFGNVHLEALASGLPVIASARAGGAELIQEGVNGSVVDPLDPGAIAAAIEKLRSRSPEEVVEAARRAAEPYSYLAQATAFERVYRSLSRPGAHNS
jgi:UDP-glucose:(heptosyl)LPS alpha-1,3-glucosyltransferase